MGPCTTASSICTHTTLNWTFWKKDRQQTAFRFRGRCTVSIVNGSRSAYSRTHPVPTLHRGRADIRHKTCAEPSQARQLKNGRTAKLGGGSPHRSSGESLGAAPQLLLFPHSRAVSISSKRQESHPARCGKPGGHPCRSGDFQAPRRAPATSGNPPLRGPCVHPAFLAISFSGSCRVTQMRAARWMDRDRRNMGGGQLR